MATADELLRSSSLQPNPEGHIVVGGDRFITVPSNLKRLGVQYDHNMETVTFDCPRYWDNRDMSQMAIYINYMLSNGYADRYPADNVRADEDVVHFDWTISRNVTQIAGTVSFLICVMKTDTEGNEERHWNSELCRDCYISAGMETEESPVDTYPDLVTQLLLRMASVEQINVQANEMQELYDATVEVANTAEEVKNEALDASDYIKNSYANAIKENYSGQIIRVDDVSPIQHTVVAHVGGKNRFNIADYSTEKDYSNGKTIYAISAANLVIGKTYTVSSTIPMQWFKISNSATGYSCVGISNSTTGFMSYTFTHNRNVNIRESDPLYIYVNNLDLTAMYDLSILETMEICIVEGSSASEYEPFVNPSTMTVTACGANIFKPGEVSDYYHIGDMTITAGGDISVGVTSSNSSHAVNIKRKYPPGKYAIAFTYSAEQPRVLIRVYDKFGTELTQCSDLTSLGFQYNEAYKGFFKNGLSHIVTIPDRVAYWCMGFVFPVSTSTPVGATAKVSHAQIQRADTIGIFEAYKGVEYTPTPDGTVEITSIDPTMTIFSDMPGVSIDIEYNADTKTYLDNCFRPTDEQVTAAVLAYMKAHPANGTTVTIGDVTLLASKWKGSASPYSQVVEIAGVTENSQVDLTPSIAQLAIFHDKDLAFVTENANGIVTVYALGDKPSNDYTIQVTITEVYV